MLSGSGTAMLQIPVIGKDSRRHNLTGPALFVRQKDKIDQRRLRNLLHFFYFTSTIASSKTGKEDKFWPWIQTEKELDCSLSCNIYLLIFLYADILKHF